MKDDCLIKLLAIALVISISCNIGAVFVLSERLKESEIEAYNSWIADDSIKAKEFKRVLSNWLRFECIFDNETHSLETNSYSDGNITLRIDSIPHMKVSLDDRYYPVEGSNNTWRFCNVPCGSSITWYLSLNRYPRHNFTITVVKTIDVLEDIYLRSGTKHYFAPVTCIFKVKT